jgi:hypothetical protein
MAWLAVGLAVLAVLVVFALAVRRRPRRAPEVGQLSAYHDGLDALTRLDERRGTPG